MKRILVDCPRETDGDKPASLREAKLTDEEEIALITRLDNEAFKEHFNYRPITVEETKYLRLGSPFWKSQKAWFATVDNQTVGYAVTGIDERLNREKNTRHGWVLDIGVLKPYRRRDVGTTLMLRAMTYLKTQGMEDALLYVDDQNPTHAMKLYEKVGFQTYHKSISYEIQLV
jgi:ribosomal protein S18 acetylase RimI-like enzyme